jgi:DNA-binding SARP family transcriptional activator
VLDAYTGLIAASELAEAVALLDRALRIDPYNEDLHRQALHALAAVGDLAAIPRLRDSYARRLTEAGLEAPTALIALADRLTGGHPAPSC